MLEADKGKTNLAVKRKQHKKSSQKSCKYGVEHYKHIQNVKQFQ